ncbi:MAG: RHS repeat-associated core domain-containing protein, partial [Planctomycetota bacterium]
DNEGNVTRKTRISDNTYTVYTWNHRNQLTDVSERTSANALTKRTVYEYDAFGRRVMDSLDRTGDGIYDQIDRWFHDGPDRLFQIRDSDGQGTAQVFRISNRYLHGDATDRVIADEQFASGLGPAYQSAAASTATGTTLWSVADQLGSARDLVDNSGIVRKHVIYDSFGKRLSEVNRAAGTGAVLPALSALAVDSVFGYTGADWDADVGLTNHDARWYDANTGRWLSQDPIGFAAQDPNLYRYVGNSANNAADPSGLDWWPKALTLEFWVGGGSASKEQQEDTRKANALRNEMLMPYDSLQNARDRSKFAGEYPGAILDTAENTAIEIATTFIPGPADNACVNGVRANRMKNLQKAADKAEDALSASKGIRSKIGHVTPWGQMTTAQRKAFQHSYTRHASELGLPNWSQKNAEALRCQFNNIVGHIRDNGTMLPPGIKKPFNGRWT